METQNSRELKQYIRTYWPVIVAFAILLLFLLLPQSPLYTVETQNIPVQATVVDKGDSLGVSSDQNQFDFGKLRQGLSATKRVDIENQDRLSRVKILQTGNISEFLTVSPQKAVLSPGEQHAVEITFRAEQPGTYSGSITIQMRTAKTGIAAPVLRWLP